MEQNPPDAGKAIHCPCSQAGASVQRVRDVPRGTWGQGEAAMCWSSPSDCYRGLNMGAANTTLAWLHVGYPLNYCHIPISTGRTGLHQSGEEVSGMWCICTSSGAGGQHPLSGSSEDPSFWIRVNNCTSALWAYLGALFSPGKTAKFCFGWWSITHDLWSSGSQKMGLYAHQMTTKSLPIEKCSL